MLWKSVAVVAVVVVVVAAAAAAGADAVDCASVPGKRATGVNLMKDNPGLASTVSPSMYVLDEWLGRLEPDSKSDDDEVALVTHLAVSYRMTSENGHGKARP